ncbi:dynamin-related protein 4C [Cannabis sativa]|uniref:Uncharacterized protein n=1 Tax=Cannabis sativa TaxID=3483 RepID=A0A803QE88_CANSA|nr:dynamin-related protein 4C [Cannabis sativa]
MGSFEKQTTYYSDTKSSSTDIDHDQTTSDEVVQNHNQAPPLMAPIVSSYNDHIRPLLDAVDKLRTLAVMEEGVQLPTIVVVGDQSSGKSSVLESLARISLPRGQGICTRVPLVVRLQNHTEPEAELYLEYKNRVVHTDEQHLAGAITAATDVIAGNGKGISKTPLTLVVKKKGVPDLTMVDLPGITRVPVQGQPENIYDEIKDIIMEYIEPEASIILNVLSATVDFPTCESIRMSQIVDKTGERTLAVVTKSDKSPEGLLEKVTADDVNIGLGYVCVRNRIGDESYMEARDEETKLFETHPLLLKMDKSIVGIPVLAQKLMRIQAKSIDRNLPDIDKKINDKLNKSLSEFRKLPKSISSTAEALTTFMRITGSVKESLRKILLRGEFHEYPGEKNMHCTARLVEMLNSFSDELNECPESDPKRKFLMEEFECLEEAKEISLPNFLPRTAFLSLLQSKVNGISTIPIAFVEKLWKYIEEVLISVLMSHVEDYHQLQISARRAGLNLIEKMKEKSMNWVLEVIEMEKLTDYTCNPEFMRDWNKFMCQKEEFMVEVNNQSRFRMELEGFGMIEFENLRHFPNLLDQAFDLRMRIVSYWKVVLRRLVDLMALNMRLSLDKLVNKELEMEIVSELMDPHGNGIEKLMEEAPNVAAKRARLTATVNKLKECREILAKIKGRINTTSSDYN